MNRTRVKYGTLMWLFAGGSVWLKNWSEVNSDAGANEHVGKYIGIYFAFGVGSAALVVMQTLILWIFCSIEVSLPTQRSPLIALVLLHCVPGIHALACVGETDRTLANAGGRGNTGLPEAA